MFPEYKDGRGFGHASREIDWLISSKLPDEGGTNAAGKEYVAKFNAYSTDAARLTIKLSILACLAPDKHDKARMIKICKSIKAQRAKMKYVKEKIKRNPVPDIWRGVLDTTLEGVNKRLRYLEGTVIDENIRLMDGVYPYLLWLEQQQIDVLDDFCGVLGIEDRFRALDHMDRAGEYLERIRAADIPDGIRERAARETAEARRVKAAQDRIMREAAEREAKEKARKQKDMLEQELMAYLSRASSSKTGSGKYSESDRYMACGYVSGSRPRVGFLTATSSVTKNEERAAVGKKDRIERVVQAFLLRTGEGARAEIQKIEYVPDIDKYADEVV